ncbi:MULTISPECIES: hypothetical protein [Bradyrhizobium]|jgi:hypothetical protein|uniref:Uncharacterized protein n=1 Tax=Bradyrhizobium elkanii TaxID=29448 RepID=A0A8I1Y5J4_BRAEL|nr:MULTISPECIES: hypothetical protein [Bradyrhizobium]MBP1293665.1 hypothetical protein [Bradyrhizobium elkanii]MCP1925752.1 hypothetical protein [Bradyrhizobium elkanii]MCS3451386.1 hypothetical protein [Bradyrhizobium elkanii]MCS3476757.1 hypothetical protein [Bradyrhizobium elkanii]MCS3566589.1 hypothetical protein [Bradyrhizobium elkanii]
MTREEASENAIEALTQWSQGKVATSVVLAAIAKLEVTRPPPRRPPSGRALRGRPLTIANEAVAMDRLKFMPVFEAAIRSADPEKLATLRVAIGERGAPKSLQ